MDTHYRLPALDQDNCAFWTGGKDGYLHICFCSHCQKYQHPPLPTCVHCGNNAVQYPKVSGEGVVVSYSVNWQPWFAGQDVPFVLAVVELVEQQGLWLMTNIVECDIDALHIGMPVVVSFVHRDDVWLPVFQPRTSN